MSTPTPRDRQKLLAEAIRVLTEAARGARTRGSDEDAHTEPADFAEFLTLAVAGAAANIGGIEAILAGRPGSWEADHVRQMLYSTVGDEENQLWLHRTEPLQFRIDVGDLMIDYDQWRLYDEAEREIMDQDQQITEGYTWTGPTPDPPPPPMPPELEAQVEALDQLRERLEDQQRAEWAAYGDALAQNIRRIAPDVLPELQVPVEVEVNADPDNVSGRSTVRDDDMTLRVWELAINQTPLPSGLAPAEYPAEFAADFAAADREAGRTPRARLDATTHDETAE